MTLPASGYLLSIRILLLSTLISAAAYVDAAAGILPGDINGDYAVTLDDAVASLQIVAGAAPAPLNPGGDVDGDSRLGIAEAIYVLQVVSGRIASIPFNLFAVGDSISEGEAAEGDIGAAHHESVWSSGYDANFGPDRASLNERLENRYPEVFQANAAGALDTVFNHARSGATMADFLNQVAGTQTVTGVIDAAEQNSEAGKVGLLTIMLGSNDVCTGDVSEPMTDLVQFALDFEAGLDALADSPVTRNAHIHVVGIPAIYWLWQAKRSRIWCLLAWLAVPCQNLLSDASTMDCANSTSHLEPDTIYEGQDTGACLRRKEFHRDIKEYNRILADTVAEYRGNGRLPNIFFTDIYNIQFGDEDVNNGDCFHPSLAGQARLAQEAWCRAPWGENDPFCSP